MFCSVPPVILVVDLVVRPVVDPVVFLEVLLFYLLFLLCIIWGILFYEGAFDSKIEESYEDQDCDMPILF